MTESVTKQEIERARRTLAQLSGGDAFSALALEEAIRTITRAELVRFDLRQHKRALTQPQVRGRH